MYVVPMSHPTALNSHAAAAGIIMVAPTLGEVSRVIMNQCHYVTGHTEVTTMYAITWSINQLNNEVVKGLSFSFLFVTTKHACTMTTN